MVILKDNKKLSDPAEGSPSPCSRPWDWPRLAQGRRLQSMSQQLPYMLRISWTHGSPSKVDHEIGIDAEWTVSAGCPRPAELLYQDCTDYFSKVHVRWPPNQRPTSSALAFDLESCLLVPHTFAGTFDTHQHSHPCSSHSLWHHNQFSFLSILDCHLWFVSTMSLVLPSGHSLCLKQVQSRESRKYACFQPLAVCLSVRSFVITLAS